MTNFDAEKLLHGRLAKNSKGDAPYACAGAARLRVGTA